MSDLMMIWRFDGSIPTSDPWESIKGRPLTDIEFDRIVNHEFLKQFKPFRDGNYLFVKIHPRWYGMEGSRPVMDRIELFLFDILGIKPAPENIEPLVITPLPKIKYSSDPGFFHFDFHNDEVISYEFEFLNKTDKLRKWLTILPSGYYDFLDRMENYGCHDSYGDDRNIFAFDSSEIASENHLTVMEKWHNYFLKKGYNLGPITKTS